MWSDQHRLKGLSGRAGSGRKVHEERVAENSPNLMKNQCSLFYPRLDSKINTRRWTLRWTQHGKTVGNQKQRKVLKELKGNSLPSTRPCNEVNGGLPTRKKGTKRLLGKQPKLADRKNRPVTKNSRSSKNLQQVKEFFPRYQETLSQFAANTPILEEPLEEERAALSSVLAWEIHGQRSLAAAAMQS